MRSARLTGVAGLLLAAVIFVGNVLVGGDCPDETPFQLTLDVPGSRTEVAGGKSLRVLDLWVHPNEPLSFVVTANLTLRAPANALKVDPCGLFSLFVEHQASTLSIERLEDQLFGGFPGFQPVESESQNGIIAVAPLCTGHPALEIYGGVALLKAEYSLTAPHATSGKTITTRLEPGSFRGRPAIDTTVRAPDGRRVIPCHEALEVRIHVTDEPIFVRGDVNSDSVVNLADGVEILQVVFQNQPRSRCMAAADTNLDGSVDVADAIYLFAYFYLGGRTPSPPFPNRAPAARPNPDYPCTE